MRDEFRFALGLLLTAGSWLFRRHILRVDALEEAQEAQRVEIASLKAEFHEFKRQQFSTGHTRGERAPRT